MGGHKILPISLIKFNIYLQKSASIQSGTKFADTFLPPPPSVRSTVQCPKPNQAVPAGFSGTVEYGCANGNLEYLSGQCHPNCKPMLYNASALL